MAPTRKTGSDGSQISALEAYDAAIYQAHKKGLTDPQIVKWLADSGVKASRIQVIRSRRRTEKRNAKAAAAVPPTPATPRPVPKPPAPPPAKQPTRSVPPIKPLPAAAKIDPERMPPPLPSQPPPAELPPEPSCELVDRVHRPDLDKMTDHELLGVVVRDLYEDLLASRRRGRDQLSQLTYVNEIGKLSMLREQLRLLGEPQVAPQILQLISNMPNDRQRFADKNYQTPGLMRDLLIAHAAGGNVKAAEGAARIAAKLNEDYGPAKEALTDNDEARVVAAAKGHLVSRSYMGVVGLPPITVPLDDFAGVQAPKKPEPS